MPSLHREIVRRRNCGHGMGCRQRSFFLLVVNHRSSSVSQLPSRPIKNTCADLPFLAYSMRYLQSTGSGMNQLLAPPSPAFFRFPSFTALDASSAHPLLHSSFSLMHKRAHIRLPQPILMLLLHRTPSWMRCLRSSLRPRPWSECGKEREGGRKGGKERRLVVYFMCGVNECRSGQEKPLSI